jgi:hypothetical protein
MDTLRETLNLTEEFSAVGRTWVELDDDGSVVERGGVTRERAAFGGEQPGDHEQATERVRAASGRTVKSTKVARAGVKSGKVGKVGVKSTKGSEAIGRAKTSGRRSGTRFGG